jgi:hypothetical protein
MPTVNQMLRNNAKTQRGVPFWVLEKDYALSYLLAGMAQIEVLSQGLVLKDGTALRKFYFQNYRFSEDLDFTIRQEVEIPDLEIAIREAVHQMVRILQTLGPFDAQVERFTLRTPHPERQDAFTVRVRFPTHRDYLCRLKVKITHNEMIALPTSQRALLHNYSESPPTTQWHCYTLEEIVAEKLRALLQSYTRLQTRGWGASRVCRDYYDLWYILNSHTLRNHLLVDLVARKCAHKSVLFKSALDFFAIDLLKVARTEWNAQLCPFVPACPDVELVLRELSVLVANLNLQTQTADGMDAL